MWIRTELGNIAWRIKEDENFIYYSNGYILDKGDMKSWWINEREDSGQGGFGEYKELPHINGHGKDFMKSRGDNLIDVLEVGDDVFNNAGHRATLTEFDKEWTDKMNNGNKYYKFVGKWFNSERISGDNIVTVITHEQYMPLRQKVKE